MTNWDRYFYDICKVLASNSKCLSRKVGACVVQDKSIISTGYNGPPRGVPSCSERYISDSNLHNEMIKRKINVEDIYISECPRKTLGFKSSEGLEYCIAGHAERNALINAAREGVRVKGGIMYMSCDIPCTPCIIEIINAGISEIVVTQISYYDIMSEYLIKQSNLKVRTYDFIK